MERTVLTKKTAGNRCGFICGLLFVFASLHLATNVNAQGVGQQYVPVFNQDSECVFLLDFDGIPQQQQVVVAEAAKYWVNILKATGKMPVDPVTGEPQPVVINIFPMNVANNAGAASNGMVLSDNSLAPDRFNTVTKPQALIADGFCSEELSSPYFVDANGNYFGDGLNPHAFIGIGTGWASSTDPVDVSGRVMNDLLPVIIHEIGHALGITNDVREGVDADTGTWEYVFPEQVSRWGSRLRDANGKIAKPGLIIQHPDEFADPDKYFDIGDSRIKIDSNSNLVIHDPNEEIPVPTFVGKNALELWYGKSIDKMTAEELNRGVPIQGLLDNSGIWMFSTGGVLSHIDTTNSLMSWQEYRNYNGFIEIELATLQDIGYAVERRDFFGKSYYQDGNGYFDTKTGKWNYGTQVVNANGFSKWNYGTASYSGEPNQNNFAIGAHLFANNLNVLQTGDIFADGPGSAGVRIDGQNNQLTIDKNTVIITNGINGDGVVAAYGSNHNIIHQGYIEASNYGGKGISFNFGIPLIGDVRGSYSWITIRGTNNAIIATELIPELQGPLVNNLDITGTIIGDSVRSRATYGYADEDSGNNLQLRKEFDLGAAIYIDQTAHLQNLNIMNGAVIKGDIISYWTGPDWMVNNVNRSGSWTAPNGYPTVSAANPSRSEYNYQMGTMQTNLTFGLKAAEDGSATETVDPNFYIKYDGNINYFRYELYPATVSNWNPDDGTYSTTIQILNPDGETYSPYNQIEYDPYDPATWDVSWKNLMRADGFYYVSGATTQNTTNLDFKYFTIERDLANDKVYAGVATPGIIDLRFAAGTTELVGSKVYARNATVDAGATLVLTTDSTRAYSVLDPRSVEYGEYDGSPEIHVGTSWNDTDYNKGGTLTSKDTIIQWDQTSYPFPYGYTELMLDPAAKDKDAAYNDSTRFFTNNGRITGNGSFFVGGMTNSLSSRDGILVGTTTGTGFLGAIDRSGITYYSGTFINNGTLAPGADDGKYVGTIKIFGDLRLNPTSVYEMTLSRQLRTDSDGYPTDEDGNYIRPNGDVIDSAGNLVYDSVYNEATHLFQDVRRKRDPAYVESNDKLIVSGETRLGGTLQIDVAPGSKFDSVRSTYTVIESGLFTPGSRFDSVVSSAAFLTFLPELEFVQ
ncbi:MAG: M10 family metallopeptidase domain-containing protein, partial [Planctomycetaceae bacterium]|nr:M10 family metallopeptidase domain-containing protein [Planctomycetaceae bacterium]